MTKTFNYAEESDEKWGPQAGCVRQDIVNAHRQTWQAIARAGSFWSDSSRIEIAKRARVARAQRGELSFNRSYPDSTLSSEALEAVRKIAADAEKLKGHGRAKQLQHLVKVPTQRWFLLWLLLPLTLSQKLWEGLTSPCHLQQVAPAHRTNQKALRISVDICQW